jgi:hypothetical protein
MSRVTSRRQRSRRTTVVALEEALDHLFAGSRDDTEPLYKPTKDLQQRLRAHLGTTDADREAEEALHYCCGAPGLVIHPHYVWRRRWDAAIIVLIIICAFVEPYKAAFTDERYWYDYAIDAIFWVDILLNFLTGYTVGLHSVELNQRRITLQYLTHWFTVDFVATFPFDIVLRGEGKTGNLTGLVRLLRIIRVLRVLRMGRVLEVSSPI